MRLIFFVLLLALGPAAGLAQSVRDEAVCRDDDIDAERRVAVCTEIIEAMGDSVAAWAWDERGDAYQDVDDQAAAIADFDKALEADPDYWRAQVGKLWSHYQLDQFEQSIAAGDVLVALYPENDWYYYRRGLAHQGRGDAAAAMADYDKAIELDGGYYWSRVARGALRRTNGDHQGQLEDFNVAVAVDPWKSWAHFRRGDALEKLGRMEEAAGSYLVANTINPNQRAAKRFAEELMPVQPITPSSMDWIAPDDTAIDYLMVVLPADQRDEMELAIMALANWFSPEPLATPEAKAIITRKFEDAGDERIAIRGEVIEQDDLPRFVPRKSKRATYRGFFPERFSPVDKLVIRIDHGEPGPGSLWPLEAGKEVSGVGQMVIECPEEFHFMISLMGCGPDVEEVPLGPIEWAFRVDRAEQVFVPLGRFDTYVLRYRELAQMTLGGQTRDKITEVNWWVDTESGRWVKRTAQADDKIMTEMALRPTDP